MKKEKLTCIVDPVIYPLEAVYGAAYVFMDRVYVYLAAGKNGNIAIELTAKDGTTKKQLEGIMGEFQNELLNASLRLTLAKKNKKMRQGIIERALFSSIGEEDVWSEDDSAKSPLPWEEKL